MTAISQTQSQISSGLPSLTTSKILNSGRQIFLASREILDPRRDIEEPRSRSNEIDLHEPRTIHPPVRGCGHRTDPQLTEVRSLMTFAAFLPPPPPFSVKMWKYSTDFWPHSLDCDLIVRQYPSTGKLAVGKEKGQSV
jgi:hypothetical protein